LIEVRIMPARRSNKPAKQKGAKSSKAVASSPASKKTAAKKSALKKSSVDGSASHGATSDSNRSPGAGADTTAGTVGSGVEKATVQPLIDNHGTAYLPNCSVPIWRLIMAARAGSSDAALIEAFPGLTHEGLVAARRYAECNRENVDALIQRYGPTTVSAHAEPSEDDTFDRELSELLDRDAALYRRLAR
jgi:uncharacterized protein (DUF433 family)